ncbi:DUF2306 domain-containing protein [Ruegeria pomeroyi]|uniref:DUF2306 domain-containing protein n=1 Tax=Ruegeria pomeroyi TaxID=89184 RepID=UPI001F23ED07|nr:DUF2306 domain-containing protein [Ruegeria pomeroyi]MCE8510954.1 DUF2306 domain-containing protein [Ruegeria pomeroyi]
MIGIAGLASVLIAIVSMRIVIMGMEQGYPTLMHHSPDRVSAFWMHVLGGGIALLVMPFQFSTRLRRSRPTLHRWVGRIYCTAILIGGLAGAILAPYAAFGGVSQSGFFLLAIAWLTTTTVAYRAAVTRDFARHRGWMIRSASLTFAAVTLRIWLPLSLVAGIPFETAYPVIAWLCWVPNLLIAELYLRRQRTRASA